MMRLSTCLLCVSWFVVSVAQAQIAPLSDADKQAMQGNFGDIARGKTTERDSLLKSEAGLGTIAGQAPSATGTAGPPGGGAATPRAGSPPPGPGGAAPNARAGGPPPGSSGGIQYHPSDNPRDLSGPWTAMLITGTGELLDVPSKVRPGPQVISPYEATRLCSGASGFLSNGFNVLQRPEQITLLLANDFVRVRRVAMSAQHPADPGPTFSGNSVGHWDGNTLVVETIAVKGAIARQRDPKSLMFNHLLMATPTLHVTERITKINSSQLQVISTFEDPKRGMKSHSMRVNYRFGAMDPELEEFCESVGDLFGPGYTQGVL